MATTFRIEGEDLHLVCDQAGVRESRPFNADDLRRCEGWSKGYHQLLQAPHSDADHAAALLQLGQALRVWLDGDQGWLTGIRSALGAAGPWTVEFAASLPLTAPAKAFLDVPWELLADEHGHCAGKQNQLYSPLRRLGEPKEPKTPSEYRLSLVFMAAAPRMQPVLSYEAEEAAILKATGAIGGECKLDLAVEESGTLEQLADCVALNTPVDVLHISCHGRGEPDPALILESDEGDEQPAVPAALITNLSGNLPQLLFLSACHSAQGGGVVDSLAARLLGAGVPAVLGWDGAVRDMEAIEFAALLYRKLAALKATLPDAVGAARFALLDSSSQSATGERPRYSRDWHLARLFLGPYGGGQLAGGERARRRIGAQAGHKEFLDQKGKEVPVAGRDEFVGRRRMIQNILREFRRGASAGVLIHGMGSQGKSSMAARIANRLDRHATVVVYKRYGAADILDSFFKALGTDEVKTIVRRDREKLKDPGELAVRLRELLEGPCRQYVDQQHRPVLLVLDDLERILEKRAAGLPRVEPAYQPVLRDLIETFARADTQSRLLLTSRYEFTLPDDRGEELAGRLYPVHLAPMDEIESRKQANQKNLGGKAPPDEVREQRCIQAARGNPGLQDRLFMLAVENPEACDGALAAMERYLAESIEPDQERVREFLQGLLLDDLLALLTGDEKTLLRIATLFELPVPIAAFNDLVDALALDAGKPPGRRLLALGLWDAFEDAVKQEAVAVAVNPLVRPRIDALAENEATLAAQLALPKLFSCWGGEEGWRPLILDYELARLAVVCEQAEVLRVTAQRAVVWLEREFRYPDAAELAQQAIRILDAGKVPVPLGLLRVAGERWQQIGEPDEASSYYHRALKMLEKAQSTETPDDIEEHAILLGVYGRLLRGKGQLDEALNYFKEAKKLFASDNRFQREEIVAQGDIADILQSRGELEEALRIRREEQLPVYERLGDVRSRAVTMGQIADILQSRGELEEALRIRREEELPVYERLGDVRSRAVTMGQIADILQSRGELEEALRIRREEQLPVYERLGDVRSRAVTMGKIADILQSRGELEEALRIRREEQLPVYERLGDVRSRAVTMGKIADILQSRGELEEALRIRREEQLPVYERLGDVRERAVTMGKIADILQSRGELEEALRIRREEELPVYERLGDVRSRAVTMGQIADILQSRGELEEALRIRREEELPVYERLGDVRSRAVTMGQIADILQSRGELEEALRIRREEQLPVYERLGDVRERAVTMGKIADILQSRGELEEALRIRREEQLPVYERLGDVRERAVTMGKIADILQSRGELEEALRIRREEQLPVYERLGDVRSRAVTMGKIADILQSRGELEEALRIRREEELPVYERLGDVRSRAVTMGKIADILQSRGELEEALRIRREEELPVYERLGDVRSRAVTMGQIADILQSRGELEEALRIRREEELPVYERLGDVRSRAVTMGQIADILQSRGELEEALRIRREEQLPVYERLGDVRSRAAAITKIARIDLQQENYQAAFEGLAEAYQVFSKLGDLEGIIYVGIDLGQLLCAAGDKDQGIVLLDRSRQGLLKFGRETQAEQLQALMSQLA